MPAPLPTSGTYRLFVVIYEENALGKQCLVVLVAYHSIPDRTNVAMRCGESGKQVSAVLVTDLRKSGLKVTLRTSFAALGPDFRLYFDDPL